MAEIRLWRADFAPVDRGCGGIAEPTELWACSACLGHHVGFKPTAALTRQIGSKGCSLRLKPRRTRRRLKFLPGRTVMPAGTLDIRSQAGAAQSPLAQALFEIPGVSGVYFGADFITVTKNAGEWQELKPAILGAIMEHFVSGAPLLAEGACGRSADGTRRILRSGGCRDGRDHQGAHRDAGETFGRRRRRRHQIPRLSRRHGLSRDEGLLLGLPVVHRDLAAWDSKPAPPLRARRPHRRADLNRLRA